MKALAFGLVAERSSLLAFDPGYYDELLASYVVSAYLDMSPVPRFPDIPRRSRPPMYLTSWAPEPWVGMKRREPLVRYANGSRTFDQGRDWSRVHDRGDENPCDRYWVQPFDKWGARDE